MISKLRLEAEGTSLAEVLKDIEDATKAAKLPKELQVHDEHYERVHATLFKGRRVFGQGPGPAVPANPFPNSGTSIQRLPWASYGAINATSSNALPIHVTKSS